MHMRLCYLHPDAHHAVLLRGALTGDLRAMIAIAMEGGASVVGAVGEGDAPALDVVSDLLLHVGPDEERNLARACAKHDKVAVVTRHFTSPGRVTQCLKALRRQSEKRQRPIIALVVVPDPMLARLWHEAVDPPWGLAGPLAFRGPARPPLSSEEWEPNTAEWRPIAHEDDVPDSLKRAFIGDTKEAKLVRFRIMRAAFSELPVLILGENGTGKEVVAEQIHRVSRRNGERFVPVNCAAIPHDLVESVMFGHVKGAFTGADREHRGHFEEVGVGTLFLDEIGDLSLLSQAKLLRALSEKKEYQRLGDSAVRTHNARIITATNKNLAAMVAKGEFRADLLMRLRGHTIRTPTLRSRAADIPALARWFWETFEKCGARPLPDDVLLALQEPEWRGNVRELFHRLGVLYDLCGRGPIGVAELADVLSADDDQELFGDEGVGGLRAFADIRLHCYLHLSRAIDALRAAQVLMRGPMQGRSLTAATFARIAVDMARCVAVLDRLCSHPYWFYDVEVYTEVRETKGLLRAFAEAILDNAIVALRLWEDQLAGATDRSIVLLFTAMHKLESAA